MKSKIALLSVLIVLLSAIMPMTAFAADPGLESAIKATKQMFEIPENLNNFSYIVTSEGDLKVWLLSWSSKNKDEVIEVAVDDTGDILSYSKYKYTSYEDIKKLPSISRTEAQKKAEEFIKKLNSENIFDNIKLLEGNQKISLLDNTYFFSYIRTYNGIAFPQNGINISINKQTGDLESYNKNWSKNLVFPSSEKAISLKEAQEAFKKNLGLALMYKSSIEDRQIKVFGAYSPIYGSNYYIDAFTGEKLNLDRIYYDWSYGNTLKLAFSEASDAGGGIVLSPDAIAAVEEVSKLLSQEEAENLARKLNVLELDDSFTLSRASLFKGWYGEKGYEWNLNFIKSDEKVYSNVSVRIDAVTGEITSFSTGYDMPEDSAAKYDKDAAKKAVEEFLNQIQPNKFKESKYKEVENEIVKETETEAPKYYSFRYTRMANGVPFENNGITVEFNAVTGKITSYNLEWYDVEFPSLEKAVPLDKIYEIFFNEIGLELQYTTGVSDIIYERASGINSNNEVKLVYAVKSNKPSILDALTGAILDSSGKPYKEEKPLVYSDIEGHYAQDEIEVLAQAGIGLEGPQLNPDEKIKQKDFLLLISQVVDNGYAFRGKLSLSSNTETEDLYKLLIDQGIIKESEINPEGPLTREDSVKFVIRVLNYEKIAQLSDIFNCTFKDKDEISPELIGYVVLAKGLNIVNGHGDYFRPKAELKKADALIIIYNLLQL